jgi:hypothetical protein
MNNCVFSMEFRLTAFGLSWLAGMACAVAVTSAPIANAVPAAIALPTSLFI